MKHWYAKLHDNMNFIQKNESQPTMPKTFKDNIKSFMISFEIYCYNWYLYSIIYIFFNFQPIHLGHCCSYHSYALCIQDLERVQTAYYNFIYATIYMNLMGQL